MVREPLNVDRMLQNSKKIQYSRPWWFRLYREMVLNKSIIIISILSIEVICFSALCANTVPASTTVNNSTATPVVSVTSSQAINPDFYWFFPRILIVIVLVPILGWLFFY